MTPTATPHPEAHFRHVLARLPTGVVAVCGQEDGRATGLVCGSFMSVSLEPRLVAVCPAKSSRSWPAIEASGAFCANVLTDAQQDLARRFAVSGTHKFDGISWRPSATTGSPVIAGAAAWIDCRIDRRIEAGDHWLVLGEVLDLALETAAGPLVPRGRLPNTAMKCRPARPLCGDR